MSDSNYQYERRMYGSPSGGRITYAVQRIIVFTSAVFAIQLVINIPFGNGGSMGGDITSWLSFDPPNFIRGFLWQPVTYMFLHQSLSHLFFNMLLLFFIGPDVERVLSTRQFFRYYLLCGGGGVLAELLWWLVVPHQQPHIVAGASGAVMGVLIGFAVAYPDREMFLLPFPFPINVRVLVFIVVAFSLVDALNPASQDSWLTHLGGLGVGYGYMKLAPPLRIWVRNWKRKTPPPKDELDALGEAVDNIFRFEDEKRRRR